MALTLSNPSFFEDGARNAQADAFDTYVNGGTTQSIILANRSSPGGASGGVGTLATFALDGTNAFGAASSGAIAATGLPLQDASADAGSATTVNTWAILRDSTEVMRGAVTGSDTITAGQVVNLTAFTLTWPAS